jgi:hypothetical protein
LGTVGEPMSGPGGAWPDRQLRHKSTISHFMVL